MANSHFEFKKFIIHQDKCVFKVTTDSCILGGYPEIAPPQKICDIGSGTGILALMMAQKYPDAIVDAIEYDPLSANQAIENIKSSSWCDRILVFNDSIQHFSSNTKNKYDLIICNPPYFEGHLKSVNYKNNLAKHDQQLSLIELTDIIQNLLEPQGYFYTILPPFSFEKVSKDMIKKGFNIHDTLNIYNTPQKSLYRILGGFSQKQVQMKNNTLFICDKSGQYSNEYKTLLKAYYLAF